MAKRGMVAKFDEYLDRTYGTVEVMGDTFYMSMILQRLSPHKYEKMLNKWWKEQEDVRNDSK